MSREEVVAYLEEYAATLPVRYGSRVTRVERDRRGQSPWTFPFIAFVISSGVSATS
jgi:hypothetical protein